jgi:hypothetical protein
MPILAILHVAIQVYFVVHAMNNGKDRYWYFLIMGIPVIGPLAYFLSEYLPSSRGSMQLMQFTDGVERFVNPNKKVRQLKFQLEIANTIANRKSLADAYMQVNKFDEAIAMYESCLDRLHKDDVYILEGLSWAHFQKSDYKTAEKYLLQIQSLREDHNCDHLDLLLARTYAWLDKIELAEEKYQTICEAFPGEEARCRYGMLLKKLDRIAEADKQFNTILRKTKYAPRFHRRNQSWWIETSKKYVTNREKV